MKVEELSDYARANAWRPPDGLVFRVGEPAVPAGVIRLDGVLANETDVLVEVIAFPAYLVLDAPLAKKPRPGPPIPPPVPPPPVRFEIGPHASLAFSGEIVLAEREWTPGATIDVSWIFTYWTEPKPRGRFRVTLPR